MRAFLIVLICVLILGATIGGNLAGAKNVPGAAQPVTGAAATIR